MLLKDQGAFDELNVVLQFGLNRGWGCPWKGLGGVLWLMFCQLLGRLVRGSRPLFFTMVSKSVFDFTLSTAHCTSS